MAGEDSTLDESRQRREESRLRHRSLLGGLIIIVLVASALLIFFMENLLNAFDRNYEIHIVLPAATGLTPDSPVWVSGREIGVVSSIGFLPASGDSLARIVLALELPVSVRSQVRADSEVRLTSVGVMSERVVDILPGTAAARALEPGDTLRQTPKLTPAELTARAAAVRKDLSAVTAELRAQTPAVRARMLQMQRAFAGMDAAMAEARRLQLDLDANPGLALLQDPAFAESLRRTQSHAAQLPALIAQLSDRAGPAGEVRTALARLQARADSLSGQLAAATSALENPNSTLARMQQDTAITRAINAARVALDSLMADMRANPLRYVF